MWGIETHRGDWQDIDLSPLIEAGAFPTETSRILICPPLIEAGVFPTEINLHVRHPGNGLHPAPVRCTI